MEGFKISEGLVLGRLIVVNKTINRASNGSIIWLCKCECGVSKEISGNHLKQGYTKSCGCLSLELKRTHNMRNTPEFNTWVLMRQRCNNPHNNAYERYGGRGIKVCPRWDASFIDFYSDMGAKPSNKHSVERRDNDLGYSVDNCYWATPTEQNRNTRRNVKFTTSSGILSLREISDKLGIEYAHLRYKHYKNKNYILELIKQL